MSMVGCFLLTDAALVEALLADPQRISAVLEQAYEAHGPDMVDIEKAWHCLHYLLTGTAWEGVFPANFIAAGGLEVGDVDVGYGPARAFRPDDLVAIALHLDAISGRDLARRFDAPAMEQLEIYPGARPGGWSDVDVQSDESFGYFTGAFEDLKSLVSRGAANRQGMLVWLT